MFGNRLNGTDPNENPLWNEDAAPLVSFESLDGTEEADIAIVGAGVAGLSLAHHLTRLGIDPVVIEAAEPGSDATGKSAGIVTSLPVMRSPADLLNKFGETRGKQFVSLFGHSGKYLFSLIDELGLECGQLPKGFLAPARPQKSVEKLKTAASEWQSFGFDIEFMGEERTRHLTGLDVYHGALLDPGGGGVNPLAYVRELARIVKQAGARIFLHSKVTKLWKNDGVWNLDSARGTIKAKQVILCAGGGNRFLYPELARTVLPLDVYQMATEPLDPGKTSILLPDKHSLTDVHPHLFSMRYDSKDRIVTACPAFLFANSAERARKTMLRRLKKISPLLDSVSINYVWRGTAWLNTSIVPRFCSLSEGLYAVQACNGRGLAINTVLGKEIANYIYSGDARETRIEVEETEPLKGYDVVARIPQFLINSARLQAKVLGT